MNKLKIAERALMAAMVVMLLLLAVSFLPIGDSGSSGGEISLQPIVDADGKISPEVESVIAEAAVSGKEGRINVIVESYSDVSSAVKKSKGKVTGKADVGKLKFSEVEISPDRIERLAENSEVEKIYPTYTYYPTLAESVPLTNAKAFWDAGYKGSGVKVAVLDTGIDKAHPMLAGKVVAERDFSNSGTANDKIGHGTHVAGIIAGTTASGGSYSGIAPEAQLLNARVIGDDEKGSTTSIIEAIDWAVANGADVISMSLGAPTQLDAAMDDAIREAVASGVAVVVSSGNCGKGCPSYRCGAYRGVTSPGSSPSAISVGAVDKNKQAACFSSGDNIEGAGIKPDITAPGVSITSSVPNSGYQAMDGTSMSAPHVSGAVALLLQKRPELSPADVKHVLEATSTDLGPAGKDASYGSGVLDLAGALNFYSELEFKASMASQVTAGSAQRIEVQVFDDVPIIEVRGKVTKPDSTSSEFTFSSTAANTYVYGYTDTSALGNYNAEITVRYQTAPSTESTATGEKTAAYSQSFRITMPAGDFGNVEAVRIDEQQFYSKNLTGSIDFKSKAASELDVSLLLQLIENGSTKQEIRVQPAKAAAGATTTIKFNHKIEVEPGNYTLLIITDYGAGSLMNETNITAIDDVAPEILSVSYRKSIGENNPQRIIVKLKEKASLLGVGVSGGSVSGKCDTEACDFAVTQLPTPLSLTYSTKLLSETENEKDVSITIFNGLAKDSVHLIELTICDEYNNCAEKAEVRFDVRRCDGKGLLVVKTREEESVFEEAAASSSACLSVLDRSASGTPPASYLERFDAVIMTTGTDIVNINGEDAEALLGYYGKKGRLAVEGSDVAFRHGNDALMTEALHAALKEDIGFTAASLEETDSLSINATRPHPVTAGLQNPVQFNTTRDQFPDSISARNGGIELASWNGMEAGSSAMVAYESSNGAEKSLLMPFDITALDETSSARLAANTINWLLEDSKVNITPIEVKYGTAEKYLLTAKEIPKGGVCITMCYPVWELTSGTCKFNSCGSPCGIDNTTTFVREDECELAKGYFEGKGKGIIIEGEQFTTLAIIGSTEKLSSPLKVKMLIDGATISEGAAMPYKQAATDTAPPAITKIDYVSRIAFGNQQIFLAAIKEENTLSKIDVSVAADLCFDPDVICVIGGVGELVPVKSSWKLVSDNGDDKAVAVAVDNTLEKGRYYAKVTACDLSGNCAETKKWLPFTVIRSSGCGDGICQSVACLAIGCPLPETPTSCPEDCAKTKSLGCAAIAEPLLQPKDYLSCLAEKGAELASVSTDWQNSGGGSGGQASAQHNYSYNFTTSLTRGKHIVTVFANSDFSIKEKNYVNNIRDYDLNVYPKEPDLLFSGIAYHYDEDSKHVVIELNISNMGGTDAEASVRVQMGDSAAEEKSAAIKAGKTETIEFEIPSAKGAYSFEATADPDDKIAEYNESNNELTEKIYLCSREKVLVVDDNDGLFYSTAEPSSAEEFASLLRDSGYCVEKWDEAEKGTPAPEFSDTFPLVVWSAGDYFGKITNQEDTELLRNYGGSILLEGSDIAMELAEGNEIEALTGSTFSQDLMIEETKLILKEHRITEGIDSITINSEKSPYPDAVEATSGEAAAEWPNGKAAITAAEGSRKTAYYGFSVDGIKEADAMKKLVENTVQWLLEKPNTPPRIENLTSEGEAEERSFEAAAVPKITMNEGETKNFSIIATDPDGDELSYTWLLNGTTVSLNQNFSFSPEYNESGDYNIMIIVSDGQAETRLGFILTVLDTLECGTGQQRLCGMQLGVCKNSKETCSTAGKWPGCTTENYGSDYETEEGSCDGADNDCDGTVDEGFGDVDDDGIADCVDSDNDNDGVEDEEDDIIGKDNEIGFDGALKDIKIKVEKGENDDKDVKTVRINNSNKPLVEFSYNFSKGKIILRDISIEKQEEGSGKGYTIVKGLELKGGTKEVFVDRLVASSNAVCIKDEEVSAIAEVTGSCNAQNERLVKCDLQSYEQLHASPLVSCQLVKETSQFKIYGLKHSAVMEQCTDADGDGHLPAGCDSGLDCNDGNNSISPSAAEACNNADDNCNGLIDENRACNTPPNLQAIGNRTAAENSAIKFTITATDSEADELLYNSTGLPEGAGFDNATAEFTWTPGFEQFGTYAILFSVSDGLLSDSEEVNITVANTNRAPLIELVDGILEANEAEDIVIAAVATDPDGDSLTYSVNDSRFTELKETSDAGDFAWKTGYEDSGAYNVMVTVSDGSLSSSKDVIVTVADVNRPPVIADTGNKTAHENKTLRFTLHASDSDSDALTWSLKPSGISGVNFEGAEFSWTPSFEQAGIYQVTFNVSDGLAYDYEMVNITVTNVNRAPAINSVSPSESAVINEGDSLEFSAVASDPDGDSLSYGWKLNNLEVSAISSYVFSPGFEGAGEHSVAVSVSDGELNDSKEIRVTVLNVNRPPVLDALSNVTAKENEMVAVAPAATDPDGDEIYFSFTAPLDEKGMWKTTFEDAGTYTANVTASDGSLNDTEEINIIVTNVNRQPAISGVSGSLTVNENETVSIYIEASDPDGDALTYSLNEARFTSQSPGQYLWKTDFSSSGTYELLATISDGVASVSREVTITVNNVNRPPVIQAVLIEPAGLVMGEGESKSFFAAAYDSDDEPVETTWKVNGEVKSTEAVFVFTADYEGSGDYRIELSVSDSHSTTTTEMLLTVQDMLECSEGQQRLCGMQLGACSDSVERCANGKWPGCSDEDYGTSYGNNELGSELRCDGLDNNCDGTVDENCLNSGWTPVNGKWESENGIFKPSSYGQGGHALAVEHFESLGDTQVRTKVKINEKIPEVGVCGRMSLEGKGYCLSYGWGRTNEIALSYFDGFPYDPIKLKGGPHIRANGNEEFYLKLQLKGSAIKGKVWLVGAPEPDWQVETTAGMPASGSIGYYTYYTNAEFETYTAGPPDDSIEESEACEDSDGDWHRASYCGGLDCNDGNKSIHPDASELCNDIDDNCNGLIDEGCPTTYKDWNIINGNWEQESARVFPTSYGYGGHALIINKTGKVEDALISAKATIRSGTEAGLCGRMSLEGEGYCLSYGWGMRNKSVLSYYNSFPYDPISLKTGPVETIRNGESFFLKLLLNGSYLKGKIWLVNEEEPNWQVETTDKRFTSGSAGYYTYYTNASFTELNASRIE